MKMDIDVISIEHSSPSVDDKEALDILVSSTQSLPNDNNKLERYGNATNVCPTTDGFTTSNSAESLLERLQAIPLWQPSTRKR